MKEGGGGRVSRFSLGRWCHSKTSVGELAPRWLRLGVRRVAKPCIVVET